MSQQSRPALIVNPADDADFTAFVDAEQVLATGPADLEARLRQRHPMAVVRRRDLSGEERDVWYVYRDGKWLPPEAQERTDSTVDSPST